MNDFTISREKEKRLYLQALATLYGEAVAENGELYDIAFDLTEGFASITGPSVLRDSRIIKILRYAVAPSISQMKFGQYFDLKSVAKFEKKRATPETKTYSDLGLISGRVASFASENLDQNRFIWVSDISLKSDLATRYAKGWTCSVAADQNAHTKFSYLDVSKEVP